MKREFEVLNVKCGGCANTLNTKLKDQFGEITVDLDKHPRVISLDIKEEKIEELTLALRNLGYPLTTDKLSGFDSIKTTAKSFVSCAIGKMNS